MDTEGKLIMMLNYWYEYSKNEKLYRQALLNHNYTQAQLHQTRMGQLQKIMDDVVVNYLKEYPPFKPAGNIELLVNNTD